MADIVTQASVDFETTFAAGVSGLAGTIALGIFDGQGGIDQPLDTADIIETPVGSGVYSATRTAPTAVGQYVLVWSLDGTTDPDQVFVDQLIVSRTSPNVIVPEAPWLCSLEDVVRLVPGFDEDEATTEMLEKLIESESRAAATRYGREFVASPGGTETRAFDLVERNARTRKIAVGDMTSVSSVVLKTLEGDTVETLDSWVEFGFNGNRNRLGWEPITELWFPSSSLPSGLVAEVTGSWGFPSIPDDLRMSTAKLVLVRYLADAATSGTSLSDALNEQGFDAGIAFASSREVMRAYQGTRFA